MLPNVKKQNTAPPVEVPASQLLLLFAVKFRVRAPSSGGSSHKLQAEKIIKLSVIVPVVHNSVLLLLLLLLKSLKSKTE